MFRRIAFGCLLGLFVASAADLVAQEAGRVAEEVSTPAKGIEPEKQPPFEASLLILEADWSKSPTASAVRADLEAAIKGAAIPADLRQDPLAHGPEILFFGTAASYYDPPATTALLAWLQKHKLIREQQGFSTPQLVEVARLRPERGRLDAFESHLLASPTTLPPPLYAQKTKPELPPFVESAVQWRFQWLLGSPVRADSVLEPAILRDWLVLTQTLQENRTSQGQSLQGEPPVSQAELRLSLLDGASLFVHALANPNDQMVPSLRRLGIYPVLLLRPPTDALTRNVAAALSTPKKVVPIANWRTQPDFAVLRPAAKRRASSSTGSQRSVATATPQPAPGLGAYEPGSKPPFEASLLVLEDDWSKSPTAKEIEADLSRVLKGASVPAALRNDVLGHGFEILFADTNVVKYTPESAAALLAWLEKHKLLRTRVPFPAARPVNLASTSGKPVSNGFQSLLKPPSDLLPLPAAEDPAARPFVQSRLNWKWEVLFASGIDEYQVTRMLVWSRLASGHAEPNDDPVQSEYCTLSNRSEHVVFASVLTEADIPHRGELKRVAGYAVLMIRPASRPAIRDAAPMLRIPDRVEALERMNPAFYAEVPFTGATSGTASFADPPSSTASDTPKTIDPSETKRSIAALRDDYSRSETRSRELAARIRELEKQPGRNDSEVETLRSELREAVAAGFAAGLGLHEAELAEFRQRMQRLQETIVDRRRDSDRIIDRRVEDLLNPAVKGEAPAETERTGAAAKASGKDPASELEGEWRMKQETAAELSFVFLGSHLAGFIKDRLHILYRFERNDVAGPGRLFLIKVAGDPPIKTLQGEYDLKGDQLVLRVSEDSIDSRFSREKSTEYVLSRVSRAADASMREAIERAAATGAIPDAEAAGSASRPLVDGPQTGLDGVWEANDLSVPDNERVVFWKDRVATFAGEKLIGRWRIAVDRSREPHRIVKIAIDEIAVERGIYEVKGTGLRLNLAADLAAEPTTFGTERPEFIRIAAEVAPAQLKAMFAPPVSPPAGASEQRRRTSGLNDRGVETVGVVFHVQNDGTAVISCAKPGGIHFGEELYLFGERQGYAETHLGSIVVVQLLDAENAVGVPIDMPRLLRNNRYVTEGPQPGDEVARLRPRRGTGPAAGVEGEASIKRPTTDNSSSEKSGIKRNDQGAPGEISFWGQRSPGRTVVYVIDASGSMNEDNAFVKIHNELRQSLARLGPDQQFQIIHYNEKLHLSERRPGDSSALIPATEENRGRAIRFLRGVHPDGGTHHLPAIVEALRSRPDVIFLLSDGGEPSLRPSDLTQVKKLNDSRTRINTLRVGRGDDIAGADDFLKSLAYENSGGYAYRDLTKAEE